MNIYSVYHKHHHKEIIMNLYHLSQNQNAGYDTYDSVVVAAETEDKARLILPSKYGDWGEFFSSWCDSPEFVTVRLIGVADDDIAEPGVICSSFNAG